MKKLIKKILDNFDLKIIPQEDLLDFNIQKFKKSLTDSKRENRKIDIEGLMAHFSKNYKNCYGQLMQDLLVDYIINKDKGFFIEIGACDGLVHSNTYWLEKEKNWTGILCEPAEFWLTGLKKNRPNSIIETKPIFNSSAEKVNFMLNEGGRSFIVNKTYSQINNTQKLESISLNDLISNHNISKIDYLSIDTEGSEFEILKDLNFKRCKPSVITVEHNYDVTKRKNLYKLLKKNNYSRVFKSISRFDDWYVDNNIIIN